MSAANTVDEYLAGLAERDRAALEDLRRAIKAAAPDATEVISYKMTAFTQDGRFLVSYDAYKDHYSLFPASERVREACGDELPRYLSGDDPLR